MNLRLKSEYANQVHQFNVSVSRHLWQMRTGEVRYEKKALDVSLKKLSRSHRVHVVYYVIRDHFSGLLYAEVAFSTQLPSAGEFLLRAWSKKPDMDFCGMPQMMTLPKTVAERFPDLVTWLAKLGVETIAPASGFQAGIRDFATLESGIGPIVRSIGMAGEKLQQSIGQLSVYLGRRSTDGVSKVQRWSDALPAQGVRLPQL